MEEFGLSREAPVNIDVEAVRHYYQLREAKRYMQRETERLRWLAQARQAITRLAPTHLALQRIYLFGSLLQPGRFHANSDIDVAVECTELETEGLFWRTLERALQRAVDVRPYRGAIVDAVRWYGEKVYERESYHPEQ